MEWVLEKENSGSGMVQVAGRSLICSSDWGGLHLSSRILPEFRAKVFFFLNKGLSWEVSH